MKWIMLIGLAGTLAVAGCGDKAAPRSVVSSEESSQDFKPTHAQAKLQTIRLWLGAEEVLAEVAVTPIQVATGMMFRTNLDENAGMLFHLSYPQQAKFWMTNCPLPLSVAYINPQGEIRDIHEMRANDPTLVVADANDILFALEMNKGWFDRHHIVPGTIIRSERGTLLETFGRSSP